MVRIIKRIMQAVHFISPWLLRFLWGLVLLVATVVSSLWVGVPKSVRRIAEDWVDRAVMAGFPTEYDSVLYYLFAGIAFAFIVVGWIVFSFLTVLIIVVIF